jgi:hypothetical protein
MLPTLTSIAVFLAFTGASLIASLVTDFKILVERRGSETASQDAIVLEPLGERWEMEPGLLGVMVSTFSIAWRYIFHQFLVFCYWECIAMGVLFRVLIINTDANVRERYTA